jgi:hypothetical protein
VRRTGTTSASLTIVSHEAVACDVDARVQVVFNRIEAYDLEGRLQETWLGRAHLRWWSRDELTELLDAVGFVDVEAIGDDEEWVALARTPR